MSWSLNSTGKASAAAAQIAGQVASAHVSDAGEQKTIELVGGVIAQALGTFDPERLVRVEAQGSMGYAEYANKTSPFQSFKLEVYPIHLTA